MASYVFVLIAVTTTGFIFKERTVSALVFQTEKACLEAADEVRRKYSVELLVCKKMEVGP